MKTEAYPKKLLGGYKQLMQAYPEHYKLRENVAGILKDYFNDSKKGTIIDIGCGTGETTKYILKQNPEIKIIAIDNSEQMISGLKDNLKDYIANGRVIPICQDIFDYIKEVDTSSFDGIASSWTIHNFTKNKRNYLLKEIFRTLKPEGIFVNMDKYVSDDPREEQQSFDEFVRGKKLSISDKSILNTVIKHEDEDRHPDIIMKKLESKVEMKDVGFRDIQFHKEVGREIVMSCYR